MEYAVHVLPHSAPENGKMQELLNREASQGWRVVAVNQAYPTSDVIITMSR